jgi:hypothetical protein
MTHHHCPECERGCTKVVHTEFMTTLIERVRVCENCPTQYTVSYGMPEIVNVETDDSAPSAEGESIPRSVRRSSSDDRQ